MLCIDKGDDSSVAKPGTQDCCIGQGGIHLSTCLFAISKIDPPPLRNSGFLLRTLGTLNFRFSVAHTSHHQPMLTPKGPSKLSSKITQTSLVQFLGILKETRTFNGGSNHTDGIFVKFVLFTYTFRRL